jgi:hypothetical protein
VSACTPILPSTDIFLHELLFQEHIFRTATFAQTVILNFKHFASLTSGCMHCYTCEVIRRISFFLRQAKLFH